MNEVLQIFFLAFALFILQYVLQRVCDSIPISPAPVGLTAYD